jgi:hypothetical protein
MSIVTDANGYASTSASVEQAHERHQRRQARAPASGSAPPTPTIPRARCSTTPTPIEEQRCDSNADRALIPPFDVTVYKDSTTVNLGTLTDDEGPKIGTTATDAADGDHEAEAAEQGDVSTTT